MQAPGPSHFKAAKHILRYLKATKHEKITYSKQAPQMTNRLYCFVNADHAGSADNSKSVGGYVLMLNGRAISLSKVLGEGGTCVYACMCVCVCDLQLGVPVQPDQLLLQRPVCRGSHCARRWYDACRCIQRDGEVTAKHSNVPMQHKTNLCKQTPRRSKDSLLAPPALLLGNSIMTDYLLNQGCCCLAFQKRVVQREHLWM
jgi:hypothetical protein